MGNSSTKAKAKWNKTHYDTYLLRMPKTGKHITKEEIETSSKNAGMSFNAYVLHAIKELNKNKLNV